MAKQTLSDILQDLHDEVAEIYDERISSVTLHISTNKPMSEIIETAKEIKRELGGEMYINEDSVILLNSYASIFIIKPEEEK